MKVNALRSFARIAAMRFLAACLACIAGPAAASAELALITWSDLPTATVGKDVVYRSTVTNYGPETATNAVVVNTLPTGWTFVWASSGCTHPSASIVRCAASSLTLFEERTFTFVARPNALGAVPMNATLTGDQADPIAGDNAGTVVVVVDTSPGPGAPVTRYRLYSPVTREHHFTTDLNEYNTLGGYVGTWTQEGTAGKVLNNPGSYNGITAVPYYRLYNTTTRWHHWTTDANEYYTLVQYPGWNGEGVDGYLLPSSTVGTTPLYRLLYPFVAGLHHWTVDPVEYNALVTTYGWIGEGGTGYVVQ